MMPILKEREQLYSRKTWIWGGLEPVFCAHRLSCCCTAFNSKLTIETMGHSSQFSQLKPFKSPSLYACGCDKSAFFLRGSTVTSWYFVLRNSCKSLLLFRCVRSGILHSYRRMYWWFGFTVARKLAGILEIVQSTCWVDPLTSLLTCHLYFLLAEVPRVPFQCANRNFLFLSHSNDKRREVASEQCAVAALVKQATSCSVRGCIVTVRTTQWWEVRTVRMVRKTSDMEL